MQCPKDFFKLGCLLILLSLNIPAKGQSDSSYGGPRKIPALEHRIGIDLSPGYVFPTDPFFKGENKARKTIRNTFSAHLKYAFKFRKNTRLGRFYPHAFQGVGIAFNTYGNRTEVGNPIALYVFQNSRIAKLGPDLSLDYEWNFGASFFWKDYDYRKNNMNRVVGSPVNAYIHLSLLLDWKMSRNWNLTAGIGLAHCSNGNTSYPNAGVNSIAFRAGSVYTFRPESGEMTGNQDRPYNMEVFHPHMTYDLTLYGATRKKGLYATESYQAMVIPGSFGILGINFNPMYNFNRIFSLGASLDIQYDESANVVDYIANDVVDKTHIHCYRPPFQKQIGAGVSVRGEVSMPIFSINFGIGKNFIGRGDDLDRFYQILALKTHLGRRLFLHVGYQLYRFKDPNNLMLGIGYRFNAR